MRRAVLLFVPLCSLMLAADKPTPYKPIAVIDAGGHNARVMKLIFNRGGQELISVSEDKTVRLWDLNTGELNRVIRPPIGPGKDGMLYTAALSPDGRLLAVGGLGSENGDKPIHLIDLATGGIDKVLKGHEAAVTALAFTPDGQHLISGSHDMTARIWSVASGEAERVLKAHTQSIYSVAVSPNSRFVVTGSFDKTARIWSVSSGATVATLTEHKGEVRCVAWSPDGRTVATASYDRSIILWDPSGKAVHRFAELGNQITSMNFTPDSAELLYTHGGSASNKFECVMISLETGKIRVRFNRHTNTVQEGAISPNGRLAATTGGNDPEIFVWSTANAAPLRKLSGAGRSPWSVAWSTDGKTIAWGNSRNTATEAAAKLERTFDLGALEFGPAPNASFRRAQFTRGDLFLEHGDASQVLVKQGQRTVATIKLADSYEDVRCFTFLPKNQVAVGGDFGLYVYEQNTGKLVKELLGHTGAIVALAPSPDGRFLLSASGDQTLKVWNLERLAPLMTIFVARDDWIIWNPEGYYTSSPGGERLMGWHESAGPEKMGRFIPAVNCRKSLLRDDLVRQLISTGSTDQALAAADAESGRKSPKLNVATVLPPKVQITQPERSGTRLQGPTIQVKATARSVNQHPVTALRLLVDGRPYQGAAGLKQINPARTEAGETWDVELVPGRHRLSVQAEGPFSQTTSEAVEVLIGSPSGSENSDRPNLYVLAIGVSTYPGDLKLDYAHADAEVVASTFGDKSQALFRNVVTKLITNEQATQRGILDGFEWLRKEMTQRDVGVIFFAGHAAKDQQNNLYLLPVDTDVDRLLSTGVSGDLLKKMLQGLPGRVMALLDACHAGAVGGDKRRAAGALTDDYVRDLVTDDYGVIVMCASMGREVSMESSSVKHGYFTQALVEGLSGKADYGKDGVVHFNELDLYVTDRVKELTRGKQHPVTTKPTTIRSFPLTRP